MVIIIVNISLNSALYIFQLGHYLQPTIMDRLFETNFSFLVKQRTMGKGQFLYFRSFLLILTKFLFWE